jgi:hypothetical protein
MTEFVQFIDIPSARFSDVTFVCCKIEGRRYIRGRYLYGDAKANLSETLFNVQARQLAKKTAAATNAADALATRRAASPHNAEVFESADKDGERETLATEADPSDRQLNCAKSPSYVCSSVDKSALDQAGEAKERPRTPRILN